MEEFTEEVMFVIFWTNSCIFQFCWSEKNSFVSDEVGAIVFDIGAHSVRAGYAGEDCPKVT